MRREPIYLDHAATTPVEAEVLAAMLPCFDTLFGNPSAVHRWGQAAEALVERARAAVAAVLGARPGEVIFTSGGSESDNLALRGAALAARERRGADHLLTTAVEHPAVLRTARDLAERHGFRLELLPVDAHGRVDPEALAARLRPETALVSIIYANNEIGTLNPIRELAAVCRARDVAFHTDAVQAASLLELDVESLGVDLLSLGAHKFYGPKGAGVLYRRDGVPLAPLQTGGSQEGGLRAGTHSVPLIVGLAEALRLAAARRPADGPRLQAWRQTLVEGVAAQIPEARLTGHPSDRLPNHASVVFRGLDGNALLAALDLAGFACSSGSACKTGSPEPSEVLLALGITRAWALGSLRVTFGRLNQEGDAQALLAALAGCVARLRARQAAQV